MMQYFSLKKLLLIILFSFYTTSSLYSQTVEKPFLIKLNPLERNVIRGENSALILTVMVPNGFWLGDNDPAARAPAATIIKMSPSNNFYFEKANFPKPKVKGIPVHLGYTHIFEGVVNIVIPFTVAKNAVLGKQTIKLNITYTPGLNAGHLSTHIAEVYLTKINIIASKISDKINIPNPSMDPVPKGFIVAEKKVDLPEPIKTMFYRWNEDSPLPKFLHWLFVDPDNHGKHIQTVWTPFVGSTQNNGQSIGAGVGLMNVTREGIMTGTFQVRAYHNEYAGATVAMDIVSCPAAYFNYEFSAQISEDGKNKHLEFHHENLTLGKDDRFGYELGLNIGQDSRYRFFGIGAGTIEEDETNYTHQEYGGFLDFYWLPKDHIRIGIGGRIKTVDVLEGADRLKGVLPYTINQAKFASVAGIKGATVVGERLNFVYDSRNSEFTPSSGFYAKAVAEYNQITDQIVTNPNSISNYGKFTLEMRKYISTVDQKITLLLRNSWTFTTDENIPFFDLATLGGQYDIRAFDTGRFYGQHSVFASAELRYVVMQMIFMGFPVDIEMAPFIDTGQVFNSDGINGRFNVTAGMSVRILMRPNIGIIANAAVGQDGLVFTGGVNLPF